MIEARFIAVLIAGLLLGSLAAAALGLLAFAGFQGVYAVAGLGLALLFHGAPAMAHRQIVRVAVQREEPRDSLGALGGAACLVFTGLGAFVLTASAVQPEFVDEVWPILFPGLPLAGALLGLAREGRRAMLRWLEAED